jgi:predicted RNA binding protein YcfA (HicA-like mRNA interferase family)
MTSLKVRRVLRGLEKKGFVQSQRDHRFLIFCFNGKKTSIYTKVSHGGNEINDYLINQMSIQTKLEKKQFIDLVNCPFSAEDYLKELRTKGFPLTS